MNTLQPLVDFYKIHKWGQGMHMVEIERGTATLPEAFCLVEARQWLGYKTLDPLSEELRYRCEGSPVHWNDDSDRTFEQVMEMLSREDA